MSNCLFHYRNLRNKEVEEYDKCADEENRVSE